MQFSNNMFEVESFFSEFFKLKEPIAKHLWVSQYDEMSIHTQGKKPDKLIGERRPYEDDKIKDYRIKAYEAITVDPVTRAIDQLSRTFNNANVTISMDDKLKSYIEQPIFNKLKFLAYVNKNVSRRMIEDPNGILFWWIEEQDLKVLNQRIQVKPILVLTKNIQHLTEDVFSFLSGEKSVVQIPKGNNLVDSKEGDVYYVSTKTEYWKFVQYGKKSDKKFQAILIYTHNLEMLPFVILGGYEAIEPNEETNEDILYNKSFFSSFTSWANEAIRQFSDHQGIMTVSGFPIREMEPIPCPVYECKSGFIRLEGRKKKECDVCHGKGNIIPISPYGTLIRPEKKSVSDKGMNEKPMLTYISPDVNILKYSGEYVEKLLSKAEKALNLLFIEEAQSGVAKEVDREVLLSTLDAIGLNIYENIIKNSLLIIGKLAQLNTENIIINLPPSFKIKTEKEMSEEITTYNEKGAPDIVMIEATRAYLKKKFSGDKNLQRMCDLLFLIDPYFHLDIQTKTNMLASSAITDEAYQKSVNVLNVAMRYFKLNETTIAQMQDADIIKNIEAELAIVIKDLIPEKEPVFDPNGNQV